MEFVLISSVREKNDSLMHCDSFSNDSGSIHKDSSATQIRYISDIFVFRIFVNHFGIVLWLPKTNQILRGLTILTHALL